jgi:hypothetical protein
MKAVREVRGVTVAKGWSRLIVGGILLVSAAVLLWVMGSIRAQAELVELVDQVRASSRPTTLAELNDWYVEPPPGENAASLYLEAAKLMTLTNTAPKIDWLAGTLPPEGAMAAVDAHLAANALAISKAREAMVFPSARYPVDYTKFFSNPGLPTWLSRARMLLELLILEANAHAEHGDSSAAVQSMRNAFHVAQSLRDEPTLLAGMVHLGMFHLAVEGMASVVARVDLTEGEVATLENAVESAFNPKLLERAFAGELVFSLDHPYSDGPTFLLRADKLQFLTNLKRLSETGSQSPEEMLIAIKEIQGDVEEQPFARILMPITTISIPNLTRSYISFLESTTKFRAAQVALAVERFRARHGSLPETLDALTPGFLPSPIETIFGGGPFRYTIEGLGYSIESPSYEPGFTPITFAVVRVDGRSR